MVWSEIGSDFFRSDTRYLESDPENYLFFHKNLLMSFEYLGIHRKKTVAIFIKTVVPALRQREKKASDKLLYHCQFL